MKNILIILGLLATWVSVAQTPCVGGIAGGYPCENVDLQAFVDKVDMGGTGNVNDVWGWTDPQTGVEYALVGLTNGTAFVDISDPVNPIYVGILPTQTINSSWRDIKVVNNYAYIGSDQASGHGIQIFDLSQLGDVSNPPEIFSPTSVFTNIGGGSSHNIVSMEDSDHVVVVGASGTNGCAGGLIFLDVSNPSSPVRKGSFCEKYVHDAICFTYRGPDTEHFGKEICIGFNGSRGITIVDASDTDTPNKIGEFDYPLWRYAHQGWVTDDHKYIILNDELDERNDPSITNTLTYILDISNLDVPDLVDSYEAASQSIDHNLYTKGQYVYQANYSAGMRVLDSRNISSGDFTEVAFFDTYPSNDAVGFNSAWSVYPYFESGNVLISDIQEGLFIVKPTFPNFFMSSQKIPDVITAGDDLVIDIELKALGGYTNMVSLSTDQTIPTATLTFGSTNIAPNGSTTLTISDTENLFGAYHFVLQARGPGNDVVHDYAVSFKVNTARYYVDQSVSSSGDGSRWDQAFKTIGEAISVTPTGSKEIWVAEGTYYPTSGNDRSASFTINSTTRLIGGFEGSEVNVADRDINAHPTILSGNINNPGGGDNSYHVVVATGVRTLLTLDGFTIQEGNANGVGNSTGGGVLCSNFITNLRNCIFQNNFASQGSAIFNDGALLNMDQCNVIGDDAEMIYNNGNAIQVQGDVHLIKN